MGRRWIPPMPGGKLPGFFMVFGMGGSWSKFLQISHLMEAAPTVIV